MEQEKLIESILDRLDEVTNQINQMKSQLLRMLHQLEDSDSKEYCDDELREAENSNSDSNGQISDETISESISASQSSSEHSGSDCDISELSENDGNYSLSGTCSSDES